MVQTKPKIGRGVALFGVGVIEPSLLSPGALPARRFATQLFTNPLFQTEVVAVKPAITSLAKPFEWSSLESTDYRQYVANLKAIGCPLGNTQRHP